MTRPNILCISIDSLRRDFTSIYNDVAANTTPFLESLVDESTVYPKAISPSTWTLPVHTSIFTGLYPLEHGVTSQGDVLGEHPTFAELLSETGYNTTSFHKNGWLNAGDIIRGFATPMQDSTNSSDSSNSGSPSRKKAFAVEVGKLFPATESILTHSWREYQELRAPVFDAIELYEEWGWPNKTTVEQRKGTRTVEELISSVGDVDEPFCWFLHFNDAHWKYRPPNPYHRLFTDRRPVELVYNHSWWQRRVYETRTQRLKATAGKTTPPSTEVETFQNLYRGAISFCDELIKRVVQKLKDAGVWDETVLFVFGDHGDQFGEAGVFGHHFSVDDSVIRVPLLVRDPTGRIESGVVSTPVSLLDIYPTVLEFAGVSPPETNAVSLINGSREFAFTHYDITDNEYYTNAPERGFQHDDLPPAIQLSVWGAPEEKLVHYPKTDEYKSSDCSTIDLRPVLRAHLDEMRQIESETRRLDEDVRQQLEDMGYLRE